MSFYVIVLPNNQLEGIYDKEEVFLERERELKQQNHNCETHKFGCLAEAKEFADTLPTAKRLKIDEENKCPQQVKEQVVGMDIADSSDEEQEVVSRNSERQNAREDSKKSAATKPTTKNNDSGWMSRNTKPTAEKAVRIPEILARNFATTLPQMGTTTTPDMHGDLESLCLHKAFFVQGVRIGWPYPVIMPPQRQMCLHIISGLKNKRHVVLESPTGTGKSAALLCSVLAWHRYYRKTRTTADVEYDQEGNIITGPPKIYYCSRTHSQVAQMVASLKKTPYRPRMAVLGSRERLCIHREIKPRDGTDPTRPINANLGCQIRVSNTEKFRKNKEYYNDEEPPASVEGDSERGSAPTCPHYRQLTRTRTAVLLQRQFAPVCGCSTTGGEETARGAADLEDLVSFGLNPNVFSTAVYRDKQGSFGLSLKQADDHVTVRANPALSLGDEDRVVRINRRDVTRQTVKQVAEACRQSDNPMQVEVLRAGAVDDDDDDYSDDSPCPYYLSRALAKHAEIVFTPYNYLLDPTIREAMNIDLSGSVVVLDEAHNVEDTLREGGSGKYSEIELCQLIVMLEYMSRKRNYPSRDKKNEETEIQTDMAHETLKVLESLVLYMRQARERFEANPGNKGAEAAIREWKKFHTPDDKEFEIDYFGPSGYGKNRKLVGCKEFFEKVRFTSSKQLLEFAKFLAGNRSGGGDLSESDQRTSSLNDRLLDLVSKLAMAMQNPEHFYIACSARANGNLAYAAGEESEPRNRFKVPKKLPFVHPRSENNRDAPVPICRHESCLGNERVFHGIFCDGSAHGWEAVLSLELLTPSLLMKPITDQCRSLILASGSLAPLGSLCSELGLSSSNTPVASTQDLKKSAIEKAKPGRLQTKPPPLEAGHVVNLDKQLRAVSVGSFPDGSPLTVTYNQYKKPGFYDKLGGAIASIVESIPRGGVLVFLPSYTFLRNCIKAWNPEYGSSATWDRLTRAKTTVIVEPTGSQAEFEIAKSAYTTSVKRSGGALLFAVFRGKMSEGISFNDDFARGVICVGIPFPNSFDRAIQAKKMYNDEQRKLRGNTSLLSGGEWYSQQAYRAIAQALGRCIRHAGDYGTVILLDSRHCDDGAPAQGVCRAHKNLPKWMRLSVRNLVHQEYGKTPDGSPPIFGGYAGLSRELRNFFDSAREHAEQVTLKHKQDFEKARSKQNECDHVFDSATGKWSQTQSPQPSAVKTE